MAISSVIPAKAGIQSCRGIRAALDPGLRRGDVEDASNCS